MEQKREGQFLVSTVLSSVETPITSGVVEEWIQLQTGFKFLIACAGTFSKYFK